MSRSMACSLALWVATAAPSISNRSPVWRATHSREGWAANADLLMHSRHRNGRSTNMRLGTSLRRITAAARLVVVEIAGATSAPTVVVESVRCAVASRRVLGTSFSIWAAASTASHHVRRAQRTRAEDHLSLAVVSAARSNCSRRSTPTTASNLIACTCTHDPPRHAYVRLFPCSYSYSLLLTRAIDNQRVVAQRPSLTTRHASAHSAVGHGRPDRLSRERGGPTCQRRCARSSPSTIRPQASSDLDPASFGHDG